MENRSGLGQAQDQAKIAAEGVNPTYSIRGGGWVAKPTTLAALSRVMGWSTCNLFYSLICIIPRVLITNANRVCKDRLSIFQDCAKSEFLDEF